MLRWHVGENINIFSGKNIWEKEEINNISTK